MQKEPVVWISIVGASLTLLSVFGVALSEGKIQAIMGLATVLIPVLIGIITRKNVYSPQSAQTALNMPPDVSLDLLNRALESNVSVRPGETKTQIIEKVESAEDRANKLDG